MLGLVASLPPLARAEWSRVDLPWITVYGESQPKYLNTLATELQAMQQGVEALLGASPDRRTPLTIVILKNRGAFQPINDAVVGDARFVKAYGGYINWDWTGGVLTTYDQPRWSDTKDLVLGLASAWYLSGYPGGKTSWMQQGLVKLMGAAELRGDTLRLGKVQPEFYGALKEIGRQPTSVLLSLFPGVTRLTMRRRSMGEAKQEWIDPVELVRAHAWLLCHYLLFGREDVTLAEAGAQMRAWFASARTRAPDGKRFAEFFHLDPATLDEILYDYHWEKGHVKAIRDIPIGPVKSDWQVTPISEAEAKVAWAYAWQTYHEYARAEASLKEAATGGPALRPVWFLAAGRVALAQNRPEVAQQAFVNAWRSGARRKDLGFWMAQASLEPYRQDRPGSVSRSQMAPIFGFLRTYFQDQPQPDRGIDLWARALLLAANPEITDYWTLLKWDWVYPSDALVQAGLGMAEMKLGLAPMAKGRLMRLADNPGPNWDEVKATVEQLVLGFKMDEALVPIRRLVAAGEFDRAGAALEEWPGWNVGNLDRARAEALRQTILSHVLVAKAEAARDEGKAWAIGMHLETVNRALLSPADQARYDALKAVAE